MSFSLFGRKGCMACGRDLELNNGLCEDCTEICGPKVRQVHRNFDFLDEAYATFTYEGKVREMIQDFKFHRRKDMATGFGNFLAEEILTLGLHRRADFLSYVPMDKKSEKRRGYNQVKLLCEVCSRMMDYPMKAALVKTKTHRPQVDVPGGMRHINVRNSFRAEPIVYGRKILLVDDVLTTGATLDECARALKEGGAKEVIGVVLAADYLLQEPTEKISK